MPITSPWGTGDRWILRTHQYPVSLKPSSMFSQRPYIIKLREEREDVRHRLLTFTCAYTGQHSCIHVYMYIYIYILTLCPHTCRLPRDVTDAKQSSSILGVTVGFKSPGWNHQNECSRILDKGQCNWLFFFLFLVGGGFEKWEESA